MVTAKEYREGQKSKRKMLILTCIQTFFPREPLSVYNFKFVQIGYFIQAAECLAHCFPLRT